MKPKAFFSKLGKDDRGATAIEYGLIAALIVIAMLSALKGVADSNTRMWNKVQTTSNEAVNGTTP